MPPIVDLETARFWPRAAFLVIGPSGSGKSTCLTEFLLRPSIYFKMSTEEEALKKRSIFIFAGASNTLRSEVEDQLDASVFGKAHWPKTTLGKCTELADSLAHSNGERLHVVVIDDYAADGTKADVDAMTRLLTHYKRHEFCCIVILTHQFRFSKQNYLISDNVDRIYFTRTPRNRINLRSFARRLAVSAPAQNLAIENLVDANSPPFGIACYDGATCLFIGDFRGVEEGASKVPCVGKRCKMFSFLLSPAFLFQIFAATTRCNFILFREVD